jgi:hypothetical protein
MERYEYLLQVTKIISYFDIKKTNKQTSSFFGLYNILDIRYAQYLFFIRTKNNFSLSMINFKKK